MKRQGELDRLQPTWQPPESQGKRAAVIAVVDPWSLGDAAVETRLRILRRRDGTTGAGRARSGNYSLWIGVPNLRELEPVGGLATTGRRAEAGGV